jgi:hypothetical protein
MADDLRAALMRQAPPDELNPLIAFLILKVENNLGDPSVLRPIFI